MGLPITRRNIGEHPLSPNLHPVVDRVYRGRKIRTLAEVENQAQGLAHYQNLKGINEAAKILVQTIRQQQKLVIVGDFDADGATSTAVCILALRQMGLKNLDYLVPNRFDFGYGLSEGIVEVAHQQGAQLIVTVDSGIACLAGVARAKALGMQVIVTDHHLPGASLPNADAIVNPNQPGCEFPSKNLAGVGVAFYLMLACRAELNKTGWFETTRIPMPNLASLLDIVAVGTVADVVRLDHNNRILVHQGLQRIRSGKCRPGLKALVEVANRQLAYLSATDLGFVVGPRLNAAGRLEDMALGIECLISDDNMQARLMAAELDSLNLQRRAIETDMKEQAESLLDGLGLDNEALPAGLVLYQPDFHQGVIGIVAGRIKDKYQRPTIAFAQQDERKVKGSARSVPNLHIRDVLEEVNSKHPGLIDKFGGHAMAAGLSLDTDKIPVFEQAFVQVVERLLAGTEKQQDIVTDGELDSHELDLSLAHQLRLAGPFGQGFEVPVFDGEFDLLSQRLVGQKHLKMVLGYHGNEVDAIAFNTDVKQWPNPNVNRIQVVYQLDVNVFRGQESVQLLVNHLEAL
ncbi:single-stranded-DNA-specific exonuclease RecJ [Alteromonas aestuariivivens]|uniref:Single-stranded-DNA-specific exonuclease RecJ n=1 Tax=Alteromonas aestuariivivens TaxID=1938339 RepID=A0A3D8MD29_9ALTE|nr:single-stranded-DNA-specific exonuclease RecJ [Alteromonas aestuariivivens]RDV28083.1 single-stranded-DNA-specific exonuclease RecJ [Alteromonas aestuariivivens]